MPPRGRSTRDSEFGWTSRHRSAVGIPTHVAPDDASVIDFMREVTSLGVPVAHAEKTTVSSVWPGQNRG